jgi:Protein of unknown function (DUF4127)
MQLYSLVLAAIAFLPMDDRPVTAQLPVMLGRIAGVSVEAPPRNLIGRFLDAGRSDALIAWLNGQARRSRTPAFVISTDMLAYGGLLASRVPGASYADAASRLNELAHLRSEYPNAWIGAFGTIMRLAPTGIPAGTPFFAAYPTWSYLQQYANLHDPPLASEAASAAHLRALIGEPILDAYLATRGRDLAVDQLLLQMTDCTCTTSLPCRRISQTRILRIGRRSNREPTSSAWRWSRTPSRGPPDGRRVLR